ncbi:zinc-binding alcohol dehydrogenase family protein [Nibrella saemangeumensis]|uniref:Zinc-binding alcohol dehydrogenase family protein n=1 Tax=Nibrella saemangeumensis TaxID=1084526 RepID=A0ABP8NN80_9BACT
MQTVTLQAPGQLHYHESTFDATLLPGEALVRIHRIGVCGTDLHAYRGRQPFFTYPRILGHELGVEVIELADEASTLQIGSRCSVEPYLNCGHCIACRRGKTNCCASLQVLGVHTDGGMREYLKVPVHKLHPSLTLSYEQLALVETLAIGAHAVERAGLTPQDTVLVIGAGPIGLSVIEFVKLAGVPLVVTDREETRLAFCRSQLGVAQTLPANEDLPVRLPECLNGDLPTVVFDATGNPASMMKAFDFVAQGGKLVYVGLFQGDVTFQDPMFHRKEITLMASRNALPGTFTTIIRAMEAGRLDTTPWITHRSSLTAVAGSFPGWLEPGSGVVKAMIDLS